MKSNATYLSSAFGIAVVVVAGFIWYLLQYLWYIGCRFSAYVDRNLK